MANIRLEFSIAFRYLKARRKEGFISIIAAFSLLGIMLGVATLIVVMSVMNGFRGEITNKILGFNGHITIYPRFLPQIKDYDKLAKEIESIDGVVRATPIINGQAMASSKFDNVGVLLRGERLSDVTKKKLIAENIIQGSLNKFQGKNNIMLGLHLAERLGVNIGDKLVLISPEGKSTAIGTIPRMKAYYIAAIYNSGMYEYDNNVVFMPLEASQAFLKFGENVAAIEIITKDPHNIENIKLQIYQLLGPDYTISDWQSINASLFNALKVERRVMFLILTLIVFIAAFNIISSLIMLVKDKTRDIAILRTLGASKAMIMRIFFLCGASIGIIGTFLGFVLGISFASNVNSIKVFLEKLTGSQLFDPVIYFLSELPSEIKNEDVFMSVAVGLICSLLATIYPVWRASKQDPAEVLRYE